MRTAILLGLLCTTLVYGFLVGRYRIFPSEQVPFLSRRDSGPEPEQAQGPGAAGRGKRPQERPAPSADVPAGRWNPLRTEDPGAAREARSPDPLAGLGYSGAYSEGRGRRGVLVHDEGRTQAGLTLFCSGHSTTVYLMSLDGKLVHEWSVGVDDLWPEGLPYRTIDEHEQFIRRAHLYDNGDLIVVFEYIGIARIDKHSNPIWTHSGWNHHDVEVAPDGTVITLGMTRLSPQDVQDRFPGAELPEGALDNELVFLDASGAVSRKISIFEAFYRSDYAPYLGVMQRGRADEFHANSVDLIDATAAAAHPGFDEGDVLVSLRSPSTLILIDTEQERVTWMSVGQWRMQHQAWALDNGNVLLLDNHGGNRTSPLRSDRSRVIEYHPPTQEIVWEFPASDGVDFFTRYLGYVQRLPNGNTLVTESTQGHILEVAANGDVVWEYYSPFRAGRNEELIPTIMGAKRIDPGRLTFLGQ